jgi:hypothetical protein
LDKLEPWWFALFAIVMFCKQENCLKRLGSVVEEESRPASNPAVLDVHSPTTMLTFMIFIGGSLSVETSAGFRRKTSLDQ